MVVLIQSVVNLKYHFLMVSFPLFREYDWDFLPFRLWVGFWTAFFLLLVVAFDLSSLVRYITRFTEDCFACLIALIFIYQAFVKTFEIGIITAPVHINPAVTDSTCVCALPNLTFVDLTQNYSRIVITEATLSEIDSNAGRFESFILPLNSTSLWDGFINCSTYGGVLLGEGCQSSEFVPDVFFFSFILFAGTFTLALALARFRNSLFFPTWVRIPNCM